MPGVTAAGADSGVVIGIGGLPIRLRADDPEFLKLVEDRYAGFVNPSGKASFEFKIDLAPPGTVFPDEDVRVSWNAGQWFMERGDFRAEWNPAASRGRIRQTANPYSLDSVLRILHTLLLAKEGGFLLHAASAIRGGRAFLFAGVSGAGKTTISRLAPPDVKLLTDEISYVRREEGGYRAYGTPFAGELARVGENTSAPVAELFFLEQGPENRTEPVEPAEAARRLLRNILFLTHDEELVQRVFHSALEFAGRVPARRLIFTPTARVWELIG